MSQSPAPESNGDSRDPSGFLSEIIGAPVTVKLNSGIVYKGMSARDRNYIEINQPVGDLQSVDGYMNIAMEQTEEHVNGVVTNRYGDTFIRGNNGAFFEPISSMSVSLTTLYF